MRQIIQSSQFKRDFKRALKRGHKAGKLAELLALFVEDQALPVRCRPHKLVGKYAGRMECHIEPDWLLIYELGPHILELVRTGSHADLFD